MGRGHSGATKVEAQVRGVLIDSGLARGQEALNPWQKVEGSKRERLEGKSHGSSHIHGSGHDKTFALVGIRGARVGQGIIDGVDFVQVVFLLLFLIL